MVLAVGFGRTPRFPTTAEISHRSFPSNTESKSTAKILLCLLRITHEYKTVNIPKSTLSAASFSKSFAIIILPRAVPGVSITGSTGFGGCPKSFLSQPVGGNVRGRGDKTRWQQARWFTGPRQCCVCACARVGSVYLICVLPRRHRHRTSCSCQCARTRYSRSHIYDPPRTAVVLLLWL